MQLEGRNILITGAGSGIGRALAIACAKEGAKPILVGRRLEKLQQTAGQYQETISLSTDSTIQPEIVIWVHGLILEDRKSKAKSASKS